MIEDSRRSAEIRRMASQKVAAELMKILPDYGKDDVPMIDQFIKLTDLVDEDVVAAGDRAEAGVRRAPNRSTPEQEPEDAQPVRAKAAIEATTATLLNPKQKQKMLQFLQQFVVSAVADLKEEDGKLSQAQWKLKLWTMELPDNATHYDLVELLNEDQARDIHEYVTGELTAA